MTSDHHHRTAGSTTPSCCAPGGPQQTATGGLLQVGRRPRQPDPVDWEAGRSRSTRGQVSLPGGSFAMGDAFGEGYPGDGEGPVHEVTVGAFTIDATTVTNAAFATFVKATGYVTEAEVLGVSAVFHLQVKAERSDVVGAATGTPGGSWSAAPTGVAPTGRPPRSRTSRTTLWSR